MIFNFIIALIKLYLLIKRCGLHQVPEANLINSLKNDRVSLFEQKRLKGWWPCISELADGNREMAVRILNFS